jgi:hypothetical protein
MRKGELLLCIFHLIYLASYQTYISSSLMKSYESTVRILSDLLCNSNIWSRPRMCWWLRDLERVSGGKVVLEGIHGGLLLLPHEGSFVIALTDVGGLSGGEDRGHITRSGCSGSWVNDGSSQGSAQVSSQRRRVREEAK